MASAASAVSNDFRHAGPPLGIVATVFVVLFLAGLYPVTMFGGQPYFPGPWESADTIATFFMVAALTHFGVLVHGYEPQKAGTAESVIAFVLLVGLILTLIRPQSTRGIGLAVQGFALLGTLVGIFTIIIGI